MQLLPYLTGQGLLRYVDGSIPRPIQTIIVTPEDSGRRSIIVNLEFTTWYHQDHLVLSTILSSLTEEVLGSVVGLLTSRDVWCHLEKMFTSTSRAWIMQICMQLTTIQKKDMSIADYFNKVKRLADILSVVGKPLEDEKLTAYMMCGLSPEYDALVTSITTRVNQYTIADVYAYMLSYENRQEHNNTIVQISFANTASRNSERDGNNNNSRHNHGLGRGGCQQSGGRGGGRRQGEHPTPSKVVCQVCRKEGHDALRCWYRFDHNYQADDNKVAATVSNGYIVDPNWYMDTSATDHITNDLDRLTTKEAYTGGDQVQVANGACLSILHTGNSYIASLHRPLYLNHVLHAPKINRHLISVRKLATYNNAYVEFYPNSFFVKDQATKVTLLSRRCKNGLYMLPNKWPCQALLFAKITQECWHQRLGHPASLVTLRVLHNNHIVVAPDKSSTSICDACQ
uniref:Retrovirus-related Pol polyprotein from transposon TNT 1-94-like beta-barrel domain-containing protein n=1 Tax=Arundo donax TaxID=35708 RepID=A0A0A9GRB5_ARUDO